MQRTIFTSGFTAALSTVAAATLVACGGGNDDPSLNPLTEGQAKSLAATTIHAVLAADHVATLVTTQSLGAVDRQAASGASEPWSCEVGEGHTVGNADDPSVLLNAGDSFSLNFKGCQVATAAGWVLDGGPVLSVDGGNDIEQMWFAGADGKIALKLSANGMRMGAGTSLAGDWRLEATRSAGVLSQVVQLAAATFGSGGLTSQFDGVSFAVASNQLQNLSGQVRTSIVGHGDVAVTLSQASALQLDAAQQLRYAPTAGTVMVEAAGFRMAVVYGEQGAVTLQVDHGKDDTVDLEVLTSVQELDALLKAPVSAPVSAPVPVAADEVAACTDVDAPGGMARISAACVADPAQSRAAVRAAALARRAPVIWQNRLPLPRALRDDPKPKTKVAPLLNP